MKSLDITPVKALGLIGVVLWSLTVLIRDSSFMSIDIVRRVSYVTPNIGAAFIAFFLLDFAYHKFIRTEKKDIINIGNMLIVLILAIGSELIHDVFLNSPFDSNDIIATIGALLISGMVMKVTNMKKKV